jgi:hypothetical protein
MGAFSIGLGLILGLQFGQPTDVYVISDAVRLDLRNSQTLDGRRVGAPQEKKDILLAVKPLRLRGVRDEVLSFQLVVTGKPGPRNLAFQGLRDKRGRSAAVDFDFFEERGIEVKEPSLNHFVRSLGAGLYPDVLIPTTTVSVRPRPKVSAIWVDLWIQKKCRPGVYRGSFSVGSSQHEIELEVIDATLPDDDVAGIGAVNFGSMLTRKNKSPEAFLAWMQLAHAHHFNIEFLRSRPKLGEGDRIQWQAWADDLQGLFDGSAFTTENGYRGPRMGLPITRFVLPHTDWWPSRETDRQLPSDPGGWSRALAAWEQVALQRNWLTRKNATAFILFVNSLDEPKTEEAFDSLKAYEKLIENAALENRRNIRFRMDGGFGGDVENWPFDDWNLCGGPGWMPWKALDRQLLAHPADRLFFYASSTAGEPLTPPVVLDAPLMGMRSWAWIVYRNGLSGALNWEVDYRAGCVKNPQCSEMLMNLDANLIYRGEELGESWGEPFASIRLKTLRRGAQDVALLSLLARDDPKTAGQIAARILPETLREIDPDAKYGLWPSNVKAFEMARTAILDRLAKSPTPLALDRIPETKKPVDLWRQKAGRLAIALGVVGLLVAYMRTRRRVAAIRRAG